MGCFCREFCFGGAPLVVFSSRFGFSPLVALLCSVSVAARWLLLVSGLCPSAVAASVVSAVSGCRGSAVWLSVLLLGFCRLLAAVGCCSLAPCFLCALGCLGRGCVFLLASSAAAWLSCSVCAVARLACLGLLGLCCRACRSRLRGSKKPITSVLALDKR